jgi:hypothetical protein
MKNFILLIFFSFLSAGVYAQANNDSLAYKLERKKINAMLAQRAQKFGQYDEASLSTPGSLGFKQKRTSAGRMIY